MKIPWTPRVTVFGLFLLVVLLFVGPMITDWARGQIYLHHLSSHPCKIELTPREFPGHFWQKHLRYLEASSRYDGPKEYVVMNVQTGFTNYMVQWGNFNGQARFWVRTRLTWLFPQWNSSTWILLYNC